MSVKIDQIIRSDRKNLEVQISVEGYIIVRAPIEETMESIQDFLDSKKFYLLRTQQIAKVRYLNDLHKKYEEGEKFLFLGKERPLRIVSEQSIPLHYSEGIFYLSSSYLKFANKIFIDWYKEKAKEHIAEITDQYSKLYNIGYEKITKTKKSLPETLYLTMISITTGSIHVLGLKSKKEYKKEIKELLNAKIYN